MAYIAQLRSQHNISSFSTSISTTTTTQQQQPIALPPLPTPQPIINPYAFQSFNELEKYGKSENNYNINALNLNSMPPIPVPMPLQLMAAVTNSPQSPSLDAGKKRKLEEIMSTNDGEIGFGDDFTFGSPWAKRPRLESFDFNEQQLQMFDPDNAFGNGEFEQFDCTKCQKKFMLRSDYEGHICKDDLPQFMLTANDIMPKIE